MPRCPKCERSFEEAGFCPFDGAPLEDASEAATLQESGSPVHAVSAADGADPAVDLLRKARLRSKEIGFDRLIGKTLDGRYRIKSVLGEGGMGVVFLAEHVVIQKLVAVKMLKREATRDSSVSKRFVREARAASRIGHPNIIDVTDFGTTQNDITYSVMEYVEGATLSAVIKYEAPLPAPRVVHIAAQMARALAAAHQKGVVHRDLKPDNVFLVDRDGRRDFVKIVDFGIARMLPIPGNSQVSRLTRVGSVFGTPEYMAPEQASGKSDTDHRVDIYALGTIMYEMLTGQVPHKGKSTVRTLAMQMLDPIPPMRSVYPALDIPAELEQLIMKALAKERDERFQDMETLARAIAAFGIGEPATAGAGVGATPVAPTTTTLLDGPETEVDVHPAGEAARPVGEPAFVTRERRPEITDLDDELPAPRDRAPLAVWIGGLVLAGAAVVVIALLLRDDGGEPRAQVAGDAAPATVSPIDAAVSGAPVDAAAPMIDAAVEGKQRPRAPIRRLPIDAGTASGAPITVEVITRPKGGSLYIGDDYAGSDGTHIERPGGTRVTVRCSKPGHHPGTVRVRFDGDTGTAICRMRPRKTKCVEGIKNPFDDCP